MISITVINAFGNESEFHRIEIFYSPKLESYILEASHRQTSSKDLLEIFPERKYASPQNAKALQAALRRAETLADLATL